MRKLIIEVRVNENALRQHNPNVPWTAEEIAADAAQCHAAGASLIHFHARTPEGGAEHGGQTYSRIAAGIRARCDILLAPSLANTAGASKEARVANLLAGAGDPRTRADFLAVEPGCANMDLYDPDAHRLLSRNRLFINDFEAVDFFIAVARAHGFAPYLTSFNVSWTRAVAALLDMQDVAEPALLLFVTGGPSFIAAHPGTVAGLEAHLAFLPPGRHVEWLVCCHGGDVLPLAALAIAKGGHVSIGLGDHPYRELGQPTNADLVRRVVAMAHAAGREVATVAETRAMLGIDRAAEVKPPVR